ncbi:hypothetical protein PRIPAC_82691 [Pristionchus pacificus]|nr:hypothetical protein PRIPAC_82691 [Pristionchus pacificus]
MMRTIASILLVSYIVFGTPNCVTREFPAGTVCVCNATHCDDIEQLDNFIAPGMSILYQTDIKGARMDKTVIKQTPNPVHLTIEIDPSTIFQNIIGFGGAITDAVGVNLAALSKETQNNLIKQYYGPSGSEYTLTRVPMAASDFSLRIYTYDDNQDGDDFNMTYFALANDDYQYKIPYLKQAMELQKNIGGLKLFAAPWTPPIWLKNDPIFKGGALLKGEQNGPYYSAYAKYFVKFFEAYLAEGLPFWAVSLQNEPSDWQTIFPTATYQSNFIKDHLAPALRSSEASKNLKIMGLEDQRVYLPEWMDEFANDKDALTLLDGISVHWYADHSKPASVLSQVHDKYPDKFILYTEACNGSPTSGTAGPSLGNYTSGESYAHSIIEDLNNWVGGWVDWNIALNTQGGYSWFMNFVDSPIIVETNLNEFFKQPMYYVLAHFSKFLKPGAQVVKLKLPQLPENVEAIGAVMVNGNRYITILNRNDNEDITVSLHEKGVGSVYTTVSVPAHSLVTIIWTKY